MSHGAASYSRPKCRSSRIFAAVTRYAASVILTVALTPVALAIPLWWDRDTGNSDWGNRLNWSTSGNVADNPTQAEFDSSNNRNFVFNFAGVTQFQNVNLNAPRSVDSLVFRNSGVDIHSGSGDNGLTINSANGITLQAGANNITFNARVRLGANQNWTNETTDKLLTFNHVQTLGRALTVTGQGDTLINGVLGDLTGGNTAGVLIKTGQGRLTLANAGNNYMGGTQIGGGELVVGADGNLGAASGTLAFTGGGNGILRLNNSFDTSRAVLMNQSGTIHTNGHNTVFHGVVSGPGRLTKTGNGSLTLFGINSYSGGTTVDQGVLQGDTNGIQGSILNNSSVSFIQPNNGTYAGSMSGSGNLVKNNGGTLVLTGPNSYAGGTFVNGGVLQGNTTSL